MTGRWDEALAEYAELPEELLRVGGRLASVLTGVLEIYLHRATATEARELLSCLGSLEESIDVQDRSIHAAARRALALSREEQLRCTR